MMITEAQARADAFGVKRSETPVADSVQQTSETAIDRHSREVPPDVFCLTPPQVPPRISFVNVKRILLHAAVRALGCNPTAVELEPIRRNWEIVRFEPLTVNIHGIIIDGHKRWLVALELGVATLPCVILGVSDDEALDQILARASARNQWNLCRRIALALTQKDALRERSRENQRSGGRKKDPSILTKAQSIDVRRELGRRSGAGTGSVSKVERILAEGCPLLKNEALRGAISIDAAFKISKLDHDEQKRELGHRESKRRGRKRVKALGRAAAVRSECVGEQVREVIGQIRQLFGGLTRSGPLEKFRDPGLELLARMERELDVCDSEKAGNTVQPG
jgi:ParB-like chromosome segregation protein Spo0J